MPGTQVVQTRDKTPGAQEMSTSIMRAVDSILDILSNVPPAYRLQVLKEAESKVRLSIAKSGEIVRKVTKASRGSYLIALPASLANLSGTYRARIEGNKLVLEADGTDARIRYYGSRLRLMLPKRLVEALGYPEYVRVRVEDDRIIIEPA